MKTKVMFKSYTTLVALLLVLGTLVFSSCSQEESGNPTDVGPVKVTLSMSPFQGEVQTRTTVEGTGFEANDKIRLKIICPNSKSHELGETWGSYYNITVPSSMSDEVSFFMTSGSNSDCSYGSYEAQSTTYIYSAQNTTGTRVFVVGDYRYERPSNFFFADQSKKEHFKRSDLVWAQAVRQTGAREVHLNFKHKVAKLDITLVDDQSELSDNAILTLEGMPDIDGAEIVVGDYYADESYEDYSYNYKTKASCSYENNGKVIGIEFIDEKNSKSKVSAMTGNPYPAGGNSNSGEYAKVDNTGTYRAYQDPDDKKHYMLYVPPCNLDPDTQGNKNAVFWLRDGTKRYSVTLSQTKFEEGHCYKLKINVSKNEPVKPDPTE